MPVVFHFELNVCIVFSFYNSNRNIGLVVQEYNQPVFDSPLAVSLPRTYILPSVKETSSNNCVMFIPSGFFNCRGYEFGTYISFG
jgi:hypothetical protein